MTHRKGSHSGAGGAGRVGLFARGRDHRQLPGAVKVEAGAKGARAGRAAYSQLWDCPPQGKNVRPDRKNFPVRASGLMRSSCEHPSTRPITGKAHPTPIPAAPLWPREGAHTSRSWHVTPSLPPHPIGKGPASPRLQAGLLTLAREARYPPAARPTSSGQGLERLGRSAAPRSLTKSQSCPHTGQCSCTHCAPGTLPCPPPRGLEPRQRTPRPSSGPGPKKPVHSTCHTLRLWASRAETRRPAPPARIGVSF